MGDTELLVGLLEARTTAQVDAILGGLRIVDTDEYSWDYRGPPANKWRSGHYHWVPVGRDRGNSGRVKLASEATGPIAERSINGMEAILELERIRELCRHPGKPQPTSPRVAVQRYFGLPGST